MFWDKNKSFYQKLTAVEPSVTVKEFDQHPTAIKPFQVGMEKEEIEGIANQ